MTVPIGRAVSSANYRPSLRIVFLRSRRFCVAGGLPETPRLNDFTELGHPEKRLLDVDKIYGLL
jgi:hypothetical protein